MALVSTFLLVPGAGGMASYSHLVAQRLRDSRHEAIAIDLPAEDPAGERIGVDAARVPGGHLAALSRPEAATQALLRVR
jgi:hypothetical protein